MENKIKEFYAINKKHKNGVTQDWVILILIIIFVFISLPASVTGNQSVINYFISQQSLGKILVSPTCLTNKLPCEVFLSDKTSLIIDMPDEVSSTSIFNISAEFNTPNIQATTLRFKGVEHSHGLRKLTMSKKDAHTFNVQGILGYCGLGEMNWQAIMTVYTNNKIYQITIPFKSIDPV